MVILSDDREKLYGLRIKWSDEEFSEDSVAIVRRIKYLTMMFHSPVSMARFLKFSHNFIRIIRIWEEDR